jgi:hypothetical protein
VTNDAPRRRRRRRGRRGGERRPRENAPVNVKPRQAPWQWGTFPVFFAFAIGALVMGLFVLIAPRAFTVFLIGAVFLCVFGVAHFFGRSLRAYREDDEED